MILVRRTSTWQTRCEITDVNGGPLRRVKKWAPHFENWVLPLGTLIRVVEGRIGNTPLVARHWNTGHSEANLVMATRLAVFFDVSYYNALNSNELPCGLFLTFMPYAV